MTDFRIDSISRQKPVKLTVNNQTVRAFEGETVLAALIASGFHGFTHYGQNTRPHGALCGMGVCFECRVTIDKIPNVRACMTVVRDGMVIEIDR
jgi:sarcosine oxidase subunit alpha